MNKELNIRPIKLSDCQLISKAFASQGDDKPVALYERYFAFQGSGEYDVLIAELEGGFVGYVLIVWQSTFKEFKDLGIPEVVDFNVLKKFQRKGLGTALMEEAERRVAVMSDRVGIAFGAMKDYAPAQILYIKRGYIPWGKGLTVSGRVLEFGEMVCVDNSLMFHLSKEL